MGVLGAGQNNAVLYMKGGVTPFAPVDKASSVKWGRNLNGFSTATIEVATGQHGECCSVYGKIGTWGHEVVVFRDAKRVWEGPITNIRWRRGGVSITATDILARTRRKATGARLVETPNYVVNEAVADLQASMQADLTDYLATAGLSTGPTVSRDVKLYGGYVYDQLLELAKGGLMFTTVGRKLLLWPSTTSIGLTTTLLPLAHMSGEVEVEEDGYALSTDTVAVNDEGVHGHNYTGLDPFYGQVEHVLASEAIDVDSLNSIAAQHSQARYPAPRALNLPQDAVLSCDAPFSIEELVAGTLVPVAVDEGMCLTMHATHQLTALTVTQDTNGERVAVSLQPASGVLT